jgi:hypothetical protein
MVFSSKGQRGNYTASLAVAGFRSVPPGRRYQETGLSDLFVANGIIIEKPPQFLGPTEARGRGNLGRTKLDL